MIVVYTRSRERIEVRHGAAVTATELPTRPGNDPAKALAVFRVAEVSGYDLSAAGADS
jgi:hypothetical protein